LNDDVPNLFDSHDSPNTQNTPYINESELNDFYYSQGASSINIIHINCRSIKKNFRELVTLVDLLSRPLSIIAVTETWLNPQNEDTYSIPGYKFISSSHAEKLGGGVGIFINTDFSYKLRPDLNRMTSYIECLFIEILQQSKPNVLVGCVYRPPNTDLDLFNSEILLLSSKTDSGKKKIVLLAGDFNLDLIKEGQHAPTAEFLNNLASYSFLPVIHNPTRVSDSSATLLDNIFVNTCQYKMSSAVVYSNISDHFPIALRLETSLVKNIAPKIVKKRIYDKDSLALFYSELSYPENWSDAYDLCLVNANTSAAYESFHKRYVAIFNKCFPEKTMKLSHRLTPRQPWMSKGLVRSCLKKSKLYGIYKKSGIEGDKNNYMTYKKKLEHLLNNAEKSYYFEKIKCLSGNMHKTWKLIGERTGKVQREDIVGSFIVDGVTITDKNEIVEKFNEFIVNIGSQLAASIQPSNLHFSNYLKQTYMNSFVLFPTNAMEVINIVSALQNKQSFGFDCIPVNIMKSCISYIAEPIAVIINSSLDTGVFPDILKVAKVCPIFKSGDKSDFQNYRPISVLPSFSKIFEKVVQNRLLSYLHNNDILCKNQFGFRKKHSAYMALIDMYDKISLAIDKNESSIGIFIDLSKAFATLDHNILLKKLEHYGIRGKALDWFKSYLYNRKQCVSLNGVMSDFKSVIYGVPQGSILGPLLFILYINDIANCSVRLMFILFADDTNLFFSCKDLAHLFHNVNTELEKLSVWFRANKLSLNVKKTNYILFGLKHMPAGVTYNVSIDGQAVERVEYTKFLGVFIDEKLNWKKHIEHIASKISKGIGAMGRVRNIVPNKALLMLYYALVYPYLTYCNIVWGSACISSLTKLVSLQNRAIRLITRSPFRSSCNPLFASLKLLKLIDIVKFQTAQFMFKVKYHLLPPSCMHYVTVSNPQRPHVTRKNPYFVLIGCRTVVRENSIHIYGPKLWDSLPRDIQDAISISSLKRIMLEFVCNSYISS
jgi:hypothetical protein